MNLYETNKHKVIASQNRGAGEYRFGVYDSEDEARKAIAQELGFAKFGQFEQESCDNAGRPVFFETIEESVANWEKSGDGYSDDEFPDREAFVKTLLEHRGC